MKRPTGRNRGRPGYTYSYDSYSYGDTDSLDNSDGYYNGKDGFGYDSTGRYTRINNYDNDSYDSEYELEAVDRDYNFDDMIDHNDFGRMGGFVEQDENGILKNKFVLLAINIAAVIALILVVRLIIASIMDNYGFNDKDYSYRLVYSEFVGSYIGELMWSESYNEYINNLKRYMQYASLEEASETGKLIEIYDTGKSFKDITVELNNLIKKGEFASDHSIEDLLSVNKSVKRLSGENILMDTGRKLIGVSYKSNGYVILELKGDKLLLNIDNILKVPAGWVYELLLYLSPLDKRDMIHNLYLADSDSIATQLLCRQELLDRGEIALSKYNYVDTTRPVIYIYPTRPIDISIDVTDVKYVADFPEYSKGFRVTAYPDGTLIDKTGRMYRFLYWEGIDDDLISMGRGFVVRQDELRETLKSKLVEAGLLDKEIEDLLDYWMPIIKDYKYVQFTFQPSNFEDKLKLRIDSEEKINELRVFILFKGLDEYKDIPGQDVNYYYSTFDKERNGLTVIEWGGALVNASNKRVN